MATLPNESSTFPAFVFPGAVAVPSSDPIATIDDSRREPKLQDPQPQLSVLHLINGEHFSGAERVQQLLGKKLGQFQVRSEFACLKPGKFPTLSGLPNEQISSWPMSRRIDFSVAKKLISHVRLQQFDLLHAHTPRTAMIASIVSRKTGVPWLYHVHSPTARDSSRSLINRVNDWIERYAIRNCERLLTVSRSLRREMLRQGVERSRISVVPNGVPAIEPIDSHSRQNCTSWTLGMLALMRPRKGVEVALQAMHRIKQMQVGRPIKLQLIGGFETEDYESQIIQQRSRLGLENSVELLGFTTDIENAIRRLDALLLPSLYGEGMPMVVLEAIAAGVPVVATSVEGTPEVIRHGVEGLLAEPRDPESLAKCIVEMTSSRSCWQDMSSSALMRHRESFSDTAMACRVAKAYRKTVLSTD